jgi:hypothetical protein
LDQWALAMRWYPHWVELCRESHRESALRLLPERMRDAAYRAGSRRGYALETNRTYASWIMRYGFMAGTLNL